MINGSPLARVHAVNVFFCISTSDSGNLPIELKIYLLAWGKRYADDDPVICCGGKWLEVEISVRACSRRYGITTAPTVLRTPELCRPSPGAVTSLVHSFKKKTVDFRLPVPFSHMSKGRKRWITFFRPSVQEAFRIMLTVRYAAKDRYGAVYRPIGRSVCRRRVVTFVSVESALIGLWCDLRGPWKRI